MADSPNHQSTPLTLPTKSHEIFLKSINYYLFTTMHFLSSIILVAGLFSGTLAEGTDKTGYTGTLSSLSGGLQGTVTVVDPTTIKISNYELQDASAPALYFWGTTDGILKDGFRISNTHVTSAQPKPTDITIKLDTGKTTADFTTVGLWCEKFGIDFGQATLKPGSGSGDSNATASIASMATSAAAATSTGAAVDLTAPSYFGLLMGIAASGLFF